MLAPTCVLVIDHQPCILKLFAETLRPRGVGVVLAEDGEQGLQACRGRDFSVIFLDLRLPGLHAVQVLKRLNEIRAAGRIVLMTGDAGDPLVGEALALKLGPTTALYKPFDAAEVLRASGLPEGASERSERKPCSTVPDQTKSDAERRSLITEHVWLVESVVGRIMVTLPDSADREDLVNCGVLALIQAVDRFEPGRRVKFDAYATSVIRGAVMDKLRSQHWAPASVREKCRRIQRSLAQLEAHLGRSPDDDEIAASLRMSVDQYHELLSEASGVALVPLEALFASGDAWGQEPAGTLGDNDLQDPERLAQRRELKRALAAAIETLPQSERILIALYYYDKLTVREIGEVLGVTESRVCQIHTQALLRLRSKLPGGLEVR